MNTKKTSFYLLLLAAVMSVVSLSGCVGTVAYSDPIYDGTYASADGYVYYDGYWANGVWYGPGVWYGGYRYGYGYGVRGWGYYNAPGTSWASRPGYLRSSPGYHGAPVPVRPGYYPAAPVVVPGGNSGGGHGGHYGGGGHGGGHR